MEGVPEAVMDYYNVMLADHQNQNIQQESSFGATLASVLPTGLCTLSMIIS